MLFNSYEFICLFLPIVLMGFYFIGAKSGKYFAILWLIFSSLFFYGWWNPSYLFLLLASIVFNYFIGSLLSKKKFPSYRTSLLIMGITVNLALIAYYKYANFFVDNANYIFSSDYHLGKIILPLAISFFTFQQITYLVDSYKDGAKDYSFSHYCLFVTFFPQLIAGPIVHHREMMPQFSNRKEFIFNHSDFSIGISIFILGLFKKVVLADGVAIYATPVFSAADAGQSLSFFEAWAGALSYTFQLYFDFSGYSDMAIGAARMFGVQLPFNFDSPYKAKNIIQFWRCWHMTLSRFLRDYVYIPLGGSQYGSFNRYRNLFLTMLIGGLWHGAGWTFVFWGALHGTYLMINHACRKIRVSLGQDLNRESQLGGLVSQAITFFAVVISWVFFRAETFDGALAILAGMFGFNGAYLPESVFATLGELHLSGIFSAVGVQLTAQVMPLLDGEYRLLQLLLLSFIVFAMPNVKAFVGRAEFIFDDKNQPEKGLNVRWKPNIFWSIFMSALGLYCVLSLGKVSEFLYFQF